MKIIFCNDILVPMRVYISMLLPPEHFLFNKKKIFVQQKIEILISPGSANFQSEKVEIPKSFLLKFLSTFSCLVYILSRTRKMF